MTTQEIYDGLTDEQKAELLAMLMGSGGVHTDSGGQTPPPPAPPVKQP